MKVTLLNLTMLGLVLIATSCKSLKSLTSKDTSSTPKSNTVRPDRRDIAFIDNIEVTPGTVVTSRHKTINTASKKGNTAKTQTSTQSVSTVEPDKNLSKADIEKADYLQLKYAVMLDASVEKLNNIKLLQIIDHWWGTKYCLGGSTENCIDCSSFTQTILRDVYQVQLPRTSQEQYNNTEHIEIGELQEGDLVFFHHGGKSKRVSHVGFYLLNNKFVHASTSNGVMISDLNDSYWNQRYKGGGRVKKDNN